MSDDDNFEVDGRLTPEQEARVALLAAAELERIDKCLLSLVTDRWQKVARIVGAAMAVLDQEFPDGFYSQRIRHLVKSGIIEAAGNVDRMRYSEVRLVCTNRDQ
ncbi:MAG TPA: DUF3658 domain-containing protein [Candidatus Angelobacter sp.]|nr:DUF3658 domain-containing protein [Candidatus Angelobacter sp.]